MATRSLSPAVIPAGAVPVIADPVPVALVDDLNATFYRHVWQECPANSKATVVTVVFAVPFDIASS